MSASLSDLKKKSATELTEIGKSMELDGLGRMRKQDQIFTILKSIAKKGEDIVGEGVVEILQDGFGFLQPGHKVITRFPVRDGLQPGGRKLDIPNFNTASLVGPLNACNLSPLKYAYNCIRYFTHCQMLRASGQISITN